MGVAMIAGSLVIGAGLVVANGSFSRRNRREAVAA
jgi:hypothetical protein